MTSAAPWSVKGIGPAARETAKEQARRSGLTLGEWLTQRIKEEGEQLAADADEGPLSGAMDRLTSRIEMAEQRSTLAVSGIDQSVRGVLARLEFVERENQAMGAHFDAAAKSAAAAQAEAVERLQRVEEHIAGPRTVDAMKVLEGSVSRLANQVYDGDGRHRELITEIRRELGAVNARLESIEQGKSGEALADAASLAARLDRAEANTNDALKTLESSFHMLDRRLAMTEERLDGDEGVLSTKMERRLGEIAANLASGVEASRVQMAEQLQATSDGRFARMDQALGEMEAHIQAAERRSSQAMEKMGHEVLRVAEALNRKVMKSEHRAASAIDRVGEEVARAVGGIDARLQGHENAQVAALEKLGADITRVTERLTERMGVAERRAAQAVDEVSNQISLVSERLNQRYERGAGDFAERIRLSEERTARLLDEARERTERRLAEASRPARVEPQAESFAPPPFPDARSLPLAAVAPQHVIYPDAVPFGQAMAPGFKPVEQDFDIEDIEAATQFVAAAPVEAEPEVAIAVEPELELGAEAIADVEVEEEPDVVALLHDLPRIEPDFVDGERRGELPPKLVFFGSEDETAAEAEPVTIADEEPVPEWAQLRDEEVIPPAPALESVAPVGPTPLPTNREILDRARAAARSAQPDRPRGRTANNNGAAFAPTPFNSRRKPREANRTLLAAGFAVAALMAGAGGLIVFGAPGLSNDVTEAPRLAVALNPTPINPPATTSTLTPAAEDPAAAALFAAGQDKLDAGDNTGLEDVRQAANLGHPEAQRALAGFYKSGGAGLAKNLTEARRWYERAAAGGDRTAMHETGLMHYQGDGGPKNLTSAAQWFQRAADLGSTDSQYNLGILYEEGYGLSKNPAEAYKWYLVAARDVDPAKRTQARAAADRVKGEISREAQTAAERIAAAFTPKEQNASTQASADYLSVQRALGRLGYYRGLENGTMNPDLQKAIREYQRDQGLPANGALDAATVQRLAVFVQ